MPRLATTRRLLACGAIGAPLFVIVFLIDGATRPGYDPLYHPVSVLSLGERGFIQIANFLVMAALLLAFSVGLRRALHPGRAGLWAPVFVAAAAIGLAGAGIFPTDPFGGYPPAAVSSPELSWHANAHNIFALLVFTAVPAAAFVVARRDASQPGRRGWAAYSLVTGVAMLVFFVAFAAAIEAGSEIGGAVQRVTIVIGWLWIALLALRLLREQRTPEGG